jgi:hypothetical protein
MAGPFLERGDDIRSCIAVTVLYDSFCSGCQLGGPLQQEVYVQCRIPARPKSPSLDANEDQ